jgi:hypothetical protein
MAKLKIVSLECLQTEDSGEENVWDIDNTDEPFIKVNHRIVWNGRMDKGSKNDLTNIDSIPFEGDVKVELWERDPGYTGGEDDLLGSLVVHESQKGGGTVTQKILSKRAKYSLEYTVV